MNISIHDKDLLNFGNALRFSDLKVGDLFEDQLGNLYMKIDDITTLIVDIKKNYNAITLKNGRLCTFESGNKVARYEAEIRLEKEYFNWKKES